MAINTMEYDLALKRSEELILATTGMSLENIVPSDIIQTEKSEYYMVPVL